MYLDVRISEKFYEVLITLVVFRERDLLLSLFHFVTLEV